MSSEHVSFPLKRWKRRRFIRATEHYRRSPFLLYFGLVSFFFMLLNCFNLITHSITSSLRNRRWRFFLMSSVHINRPLSLSSLHFLVELPPSLLHSLFILSSECSSSPFLLLSLHRNSLIAPTSPEWSRFLGKDLPKPLYSNRFSESFSCPGQICLQFSSS